MRKTLVGIGVSMLLLAAASAEEGGGPVFRFVVDPRIELMNIALTFTDLPFYGKSRDVQYQYQRDVLDHFGPFENHPAIERCKTIPYFRDISFPDQAMLYCSDPPQMTLAHRPPANVPQALIDDMTALIALLNQYANEGRFMEFWQKHQVFYDRMLASLQKQLPYREYLDIVTEFYGTQPPQFVCVVSPILSGAAFGATFETEAGKVPHFITGPDRIENGEPIFTDRWLRLLIFHEYGHSFVNPLCAASRGVIAQQDSLLPYFARNETIRSVYNDWFVVVHEHVVRAVEQVLLEKVGLDEECAANLQKNLGQGFALLPILIEKIAYYDSHRDQYPTFASYFPEVLAVFAAADPTSIGRIHGSTAPGNGSGG